MKVAKIILTTYMSPIVNTERIRILREGKSIDGPVIYWMHRDMRAHDNWALLYAQELALAKNQSIRVGMVLRRDLEGHHITKRTFDFMAGGIIEVARDLEKLNIPFDVIFGEPALEIPKYLNKNRASALVTDFSPLKRSRAWKRAVGNKISVPFFEVDTHNIVPCWVASKKQEYGAYTLRPKINKALSTFLKDIPKLKKQKTEVDNQIKHLEKRLKSINVDQGVGTTDWIEPGSRAARKVLNKFLNHKLAQFDAHRNDPNMEAQSGLSPYLHFGHISSQRIALELMKVSGHKSAKEGFMEELIVRKELSDNFCLYNENYDSVAGFPEWAKKTLEEHRKDAREYLYTKQQFETAKTHDHLWNAAQIQMVKTGKMHGYMRMYWAKKILEWTRDPEEAMKIAIFLNDKYSIDGRDPNGYTGIAWSIGGVHDRAWSERPIFGKIRYMNFNGCKSKFDVKQYMNTFNGL